MKFSYIISYRHSDWRVSNLMRVLEWLGSFGDDIVCNMEVIIVESDVEELLDMEKLGDYKFKLSKIFTYTELPFERSWSFNVGILNSSSDVLVFGDSDLIMKNEEFLESINKLEEYDCVSPYSSVLDLTKEESVGDLVDWVKIIRPGRGETDNQKINLTGGIVIYKRDSVLKIGGWDENFIGWGGEDDWQTRKTNMFLRSFEMPFRCYHIWHPRVVPIQSLYMRTIGLLNKLFSLDRDSVVRYLGRTAPMIGRIDKYSKIDKNV